jgi:hypothetical protein
MRPVLLALLLLVSAQAWGQGNISGNGGEGIGGNPVGGGGSGAVNSVANSDGTLSATPTTGSVIVGLALGHANTWTAAQTFSGGISVNVTGLTQCLHVNTTGLVSGTGSDCLPGVTSVSNSDSTLTITPTTGAVVGSLNLAHANTWTALQTFGAHIAGGGTAPTVTTGTATLDSLCSDSWCTITETATQTAVAITFHAAYVTGGHCWVSSPNGSQYTSYTQSPTTALTINHLSAGGSIWVVGCGQ